MSVASLCQERQLLKNPAPLGRGAVRRYKATWQSETVATEYRLPPRPRSLNMLTPSAVCSTRCPLLLSFGYERHGI